MKIRPMTDELFHAERGTDRPPGMTKLIVFFAILRTRLETKMCLQWLLIAARVSLYYEYMKYYEKFIYIFIVSDKSHNFKQGAAFK